MKRPVICAVVVDDDPEAIKAVGPLADLFEVRIDLVGEGWQGLVKRLGKPWVACCRTVAEGGRWQGNEARRIESLLQAAGLGAEIVDVELNTPNLENIARIIKKTSRLLLSHHDLEGTPSLDEMKKTVSRQLEAGADICKVVVTARGVEDNLAVLKLIRESPGVKTVAFAMGTAGLASRVLCPLVGGEYTYASVKRGKESAAGQITAGELRSIYEMMGE